MSESPKAWYNKFMKRPALILALLAVLGTIPALYAQSRSDVERMGHTMPAAPCLAGNQSERQQWEEGNRGWRTNETGCIPGETISQCMRRQHNEK